jgi:hypothetical protein
VRVRKRNGQVVEFDSRKIKKVILVCLDEHEEKVSKKLGRRATKAQTEADLIDRKVWSFARDFRREYCLRCPGRTKCAFQKLKQKRKVKKVGIVIGKAVRSSLRKRPSKVRSTRRKS